MNDKKYIGVIVADIDEYRPFVKLAKNLNPEDITVFKKNGIRFCLNEIEVISINCGIGKVNAASVAAALALKGCCAILNFGLSGGISNTQRGRFCAPQRFLEHDFDLTPLGYKPCEKPNQNYIYSADNALLSIINTVTGGVAGGTAVCGDRFVSSDSDSAFLRATYDATSCDMETAAIASVCENADIPFAAFRMISDNAGDSANESYSEMNASGELSMQEAFMKILSAAADYYRSR